MKIDKLLARRDAVYGACALWIIMFHCFRRAGMPFIPVITPVFCLGNMAVDVFVFFSGLCLALSAERNRYEGRWGQFYKRRLLRVLVPYLLIAAPYYLWNCLAEYDGTLVQRALYFFLNLTSLSFWLRGRETTWFAYAILVYYLLFPPLYGRVKRSARQGVLLAAVAALFALAVSFIPVACNGVVLWARLPIFIVGILAGCNREKLQGGLTLRRGRPMLAAALALVIGLGWVISADELSGANRVGDIARFLMYLPMTLALLFCLSECLPTGRRAARGPLAWLGTLSFELYLTHVTLLHPLKTYGALEACGYWIYLLLPALAIAAALAFNALGRRIIHIVNHGTDNRGRARG